MISGSSGTQGAEPSPAVFLSRLHGGILAAVGTMKPAHEQHAEGNEESIASQKTQSFSALGLLLVGKRWHEAERAASSRAHRPVTQRKQARQCEASDCVMNQIPLSHRQPITRQGNANREEQPFHEHKERGNSISPDDFFIWQIVHVRNSNQGGADDEPGVDPPAGNPGTEYRSHAALARYLPSYHFP